MKEKTAKTPTIPDKLYFKIGEVAKITALKPYVLRYWESEFKIKPAKSKKNQRLYQRKDIEQFIKIKELLYEQRFTIAGAKKILRKGRGKKAKEAASPKQDQGQLDFIDIENSSMRQKLKQIRKELEALRQSVS